MSLSYDKLHEECLLDLQFREGSGLITRDWAKPHHVDPTLTGAPAWADVSGLPVLDFDDTNPDYIRILQADSVDLNFTSGNFTVAFWINIDTFTAEYLISRGTYVVEGWFVFIDGTGTMQLYTNQGAAYQATKSIVLSLNTWYLTVITRTGTVAKVYINGLDSTDVAEAHTDPLTSMADFTIGVSSGFLNGFDGQMWRPRIWGRALTPEEIKFIYERERWHF